MLVSNPCVNDTRVIRAAETVVEQGFEVVVLAVSEGGETSEERRNGVLYRRLGRPWLKAAMQPAPEVFADPAVSRAVRHLRLHLSALEAVGAGVRVCLSPLKRAIHPKAEATYRTAVRLYHLFHRHAVAYDDMLNIQGRPLRRAPGAAFRLALSMARKAKRRTMAPVRRILTNQIHLIAIRPLFDARRMTTVFKPDLIELRPDIIHAHDLITLPAGAGAARALGAKLVYDAHELEVHRNTNAGRLGTLLRYYLEQKHIKSCEAVVTVCDSIADHLAKEYAIKRPVVVMNAPDVGQELRSDTELRSSLNLSPEAPLAVYVGRITIGRGIEQIVEALQYLPGYHVALVGPVNKPTVEAAQAKAVILGVADRLHLVDPVPPGMVIPFIRSADVSVIPIQNVCLSYYYCLPNKLLESAMARLPVVVSNLPELRRFVEISESGIVMDETDPRDMARAIREAYENKERLQPDTSRLLRAEEIYGWRRQKEALKGLYASFALLHERPPQKRAKSRLPGHG